MLNIILFIYRTVIQLEVLNEMIKSFKDDFKIFKP